MSVSVNIEISGAGDFTAAMNRFDSAVKSQIQARLSDWAEMVKIDAERLVPVRTGYLQSSIYAKSQDWQVEVGAEATYAVAVEFGTYNSRAQPYLNPAIQAYLPSFDRFILQAIDSAKTEAQL
jgi:HK97 gp10 family phage protein